MTTSKPDTDSAQHLRKLEELFSGSGTKTATPITNRIQPTRDNRPVFANPRKSLGRAPSEYRLRLERLRMDREPEQIKVSADAFLEHHQLPDDPEILLKVLAHPSEQVLREAMGQLSALLMQGRLETTVILEDRLRELAGRVSEKATQAQGK